MDYIFLLNNITIPTAGLLIGLSLGPGVLRRHYRRSIGAGAEVHNLAGALNDWEGCLRYRAALLLGQRCLAEVEKAVPALLLATENSDLRTRVFAQGALGMLGIPTDETTPFLIQRAALAELAPERLLHHLQGRLSEFEAVWGLHLVALLRDGDRETARLASRIIQKKVESIGFGLAQALGDPDPDIRCCAVRALKRLGPLAHEVVPALRASAESLDPILRKSAKKALSWIQMHFLWRMLPWASAACLVCLLGLVIFWAATTYYGRLSLLCWKRDVGGVEAIPEFIEALDSPDESFRRAGAFGLHRLGPAAVPALVKGFTKGKKEPKENWPIIDVNNRRWNLTAKLHSFVEVFGKDAEPVLVRVIANRPGNGVRSEIEEALAYVRSLH